MIFISQIYKIKFFFGYKDYTFYRVTLTKMQIDS